MTTASVEPGDILAGKYRIERVLGTGGMGYVVAARHLQLDQMVAMKFLRKAVVEDSEAARRFLREAKAVVKLRNHHIAKVYDVGTLETGEPYIVMEHLDGCDLAALAKQRGIIPACEAVEYVMQACEALGEAHALGIVHRDIKLANLFVTQGPAGNVLVKVLDFGISKTNPFGESEHDMTRTASMLGSPRFMSPEQMRDPRAVDGRTDIWSLGVVLYRLVSGRSPFEAETLGHLLSMVMHEPERPLSELCPDLPPGFEHVVARCLQKDPAARFSNVAELAFALAPFSVDPVRARSAAERIAAVQSLPISGDMSGPLPMSGLRPVSGAQPMGSGQPSTPGSNDTASPWAGSHRTGRPRSSGSTYLLGAALATILVSASIFAKVRDDAKKAAPASAVATASATTQAATAEATPPPATAPAPSSSLGAGTIIGASLPTTSATSAARAENGPSARRPTTIGAPRTKATAPSRPSNATTPRDEDGIPATRD
jgi:serine/threonine-protein kinase